jgi:hypothetical protein
VHGSPVDGTTAGGREAARPGAHRRPRPAPRSNGAWVSAVATARAREGAVGDGELMKNKAKNKTSIRIDSI